ncbi:MAG: S8 family serine peptidase [Thermoanaerobaculia bacterium]
MASKKRTTASTRSTKTTKPRPKIKLRNPLPPPIAKQIALNTVPPEEPASPLEVKIAAATAAAPTVIYIHGIGNKPIASVLKCQWDMALFGVQMGERTRMAYWVNRERYPLPIAATCGTPDVTATDEEGVSALVPSLGVRAVSDRTAVEAEIAAVASSAESRRTLERIAARMDEVPGAAAFAALDVTAKVLPLPEPLRRFFARQITRVFLRDVHDFLFVREQREKMRASLKERLRTARGPLIVIAHSQGTMIAYDVLRELTKAEADVRLFVTIGSPLGMQEVKDFFRRQAKAKGPLPFPPCADKWVNVADRLDVVAIDPTLRGEYAGAITDFRVTNPDSPKHPHSGTGYLATAPVRQAVLEVVGNSFGQAIARFVIASNLSNEFEDAAPGERREVLIQLSDPDSGSAMSVTAAAVQARLEQLLTSPSERKKASIDILKRFVSANLTRGEVEELRNDFATLRIETIWKDAAKRALIFESTNTIQCRPANVSYGATGRRISWAVLDTGVRASHPHFQKHRNIVAQWDCTKPGPPVATPGDADQHGHGTHVAATIAGQYETRMKASDPPTDLIMFSGMAPEAKIHDYRVLDEQGNGKDSFIIKALDHISAINEAAGELVIHGVNLSLGGNFDPKVFGCGHTPLCQELRRLWRQGVLVVLAAGNEGYAVLQSDAGSIQANIDLSIGDPANLDEAIAVGSIHKTNPHTYGISYFSSRGPTADGRRKPDVVAPGERIISACHQYSAGATLGEELYVLMSGTSMAAPHVSGLLAAFLSLRREFIAYPDRVKEILLKNAVDLRRDPYIQGYGMPNLILMLATN